MYKTLLYFLFVYFVRHKTARNKVLTLRTRQAEYFAVTNCPITCQEKKIECS